MSIKEEIKSMSDKFDLISQEEIDQIKTLDNNELLKAYLFLLNWQRDSIIYCKGCIRISPLTAYQDKRIEYAKSKNPAICK